MALENFDEITDPYELMRLGREFGYGAPQRASLMDRAIVAADRLGELRARFDAREQRLWAAVLGGEAEMSLALFAWCQRMADDHPDIIKSTEMLWHYKLILVALPLFARISQRQIDDVGAEMLRRYQAHGVNMRSIYAKRSEVAAAQGRIHEASELWDKAMSFPRDGYADCRACELDYSVWLRTMEHRYAEVVDAAAPILAGHQSCAEVPHKTRPRVMLALHALGRHDEARRMAAGTYRLIRLNPDFVQEVAMLIEFHVAGHELSRAAEVVIRHLPWLQQIRNDKQQYHYLRAVHCLLRAVAEAPNRASQWRTQLFDALDACFGIVAPCTDGTGRLQRVSEVVAGKGSGYAVALDTRNGNDYFQRQWAEPAFVITAP